MKSLKLTCGSFNIEAELWEVMIAVTIKDNWDNTELLEFLLDENQARQLRDWLTDYLE